MLLCHVSDNHGFFPTLPTQGDIVVHSGDVCPNKSRGNRSIEVRYQSEWLKSHSKTIKDWIGDRPFIFCMGNHDFTPYVVRILLEAGVQAYDCTSQIIEVQNHTFYGFPFIPFIAGEWNCECFSDQLLREVNDLQQILEAQTIDVLVAHAPIAGTLDLNSDGESCGNIHMANLFNYSLQRKFWPRCYLHGHIHESKGQSSLDSMLISNAATGVNLIEI